jgi:putative membrane protein
MRTIRGSQLFLSLYLLSMPVYCLIRLTGDGALIALSTAATAISLFAFSLLHCIETRGAPRSLLMLGAGFGIALTMEYLGSAHDILFGAYDYTNLLGPKALGHVPIIIPIAWFMMLYPAWEIAGLITRKFIDKETGRQGDYSPGHLVTLSPTLRVILAALAMTAWDLSLDPRMAADGAWVWQNVPALNYFGIPLSNFAGWFVTSAMIYTVWSFVERTARSPRPTPHAALPVWAYVITWVGESMANALFWGGPAVAAWVFVAMGLFGAPALWLLLKGQRAGRAVAHPTPAR